MDKIPFEDGEKTQDAYVTISGQNYPVTDAVYQGTTPLSAYNLNLMQENIENAINQLINQAVSQAKLEAHPIGSLYYSENETDPSELFGGTWQRIKDKFILTAGNSYSVGETGGKATHKLTESELPTITPTFSGKAESHSHLMGVQNTSAEASGYGLNQVPTFQNRVQIDGGNKQTISTSITPKGTISSFGGNKAHNNMPPYEVFYCWKRIS